MSEWIEAERGGQAGYLSTHLQGSGFVWPHESGELWLWRFRASAFSGFEHSGSASTRDAAQTAAAECQRRGPGRKPSGPAHCWHPEPGVCEEGADGCCFCDALRYHTSPHSYGTPPTECGPFASRVYAVTYDEPACALPAALVQRLRDAVFGRGNHGPDRDPRANLMEIKPL